VSSIKILIVDDHEPVRRVLRSLIESRADWHVCGEAVNGKDGVEKAQELKPNLVLLDVSMPEMNGLEAARVIRREMPEAKVVLISQNDPAVVRRQAAEVQAHGYVGKADITRDLVPSIERLFDWKSSAELPQDSNDSNLTPARWLNAEGEMAALITRKNWAETAIGATENWSSTLRMMVGFLLANRFPLLLWWGPEYTQIYNDAYVPILGVKHPKALGQPTSQCWSEIWHVLKPLIDTPFKGGPATWIEDLELEIRRSTMFEETHFTVAYSPVPDEAAPTGIGGVLATVHEITEKIIGERRVVILRDLGAGTAETKSAEQACAIASDVLGKYPRDFPFALLYLTDNDGRCANLASCTHLVASEPGSPCLSNCQRIRRLKLFGRCRKQYGRRTSF
jgi:DNA-binding NarL/FixJ family response regulator